MNETKRDSEEKEKKGKGKQKKETGKNLLLLLVTLLMCFIILEIVVRIITPPEPAGLSPGLKIEDDLLGFRLAPNFKGWHVEYGFNVTVTTNSYGLRSKEIGEKTKTRALFLGDSVVWGFGVEDNQTLPSILDNILDGYEIINAGFSAYSTKQELDYLKRDGIELKPDVVVLGFFLGNDFIDNLVKSGNASIRVESSWFKELKASARKNVRTYPFIMGGLKNIYAVRQFLVKTGLADNQEYYQYQIYNKDYNAALQQGANFSFQYIDEMNDFCQENNITFLLLLIPSRFQVYDDSWQFLLDYNHFKEEEQDRRKPNKLLIAFAEENNIDYIDLLDDLIGIEKEIYLNRDVAHYTPEGNRLVAEILAEKFKNKF